MPPEPAPAPVKPPGSRIAIIGGGMDFTTHLTWEACKRLRAASVVFHAGCHPSVAKWLADFARQAEVIDIDLGHYQTGTYRPTMYQAMARRVVAAASDGRSVVLIEPGSACAADLVTQYVLGYAAENAIPTEVVPGVSAIELVLIEFGIDLAEGLQTVLAQELVAQDLPLNPSVDAIVFQPGYYDTLWCAGWAASRPDRYRELCRVLGRSYRPDTTLALVRFPMHPGDETHVLWFRLHEWDLVAPVITPLHTLFIPRAAAPARNDGFMRRIHTWSESIRFLQQDGAGNVVQNPPIPSNADLRRFEEQLPTELRARSTALRHAWKQGGPGRNLRRLVVG